MPSPSGNNKISVGFGGVAHTLLVPAKPARTRSEMRLGATFVHGALG
jgi:hypothetical protein